MSPRRLIELSHPIEPGMTTYPGLPPPAVSDFLSHEASRARYAAGTTFSIARIEMVANTGTYVDAPAHRFPGGTDVGNLPLERLADLDAVVIDLFPLAAGAGEREGSPLASDQSRPRPQATSREAAAGGGEGRRRAFDADLFQGRALEGKAVLLRSGWDVHWRTPEYFRGHPYLTRRGAETLAGGRPALVGIDSLNIDDTEDGTRPAHTLLLAAGIPVVERLRGLDSLPAAGFRFHCVPAPFRGVGSFPARAYAVVGEESP